MADIQESISVGNLLYWVSRDHGKSNLDLWKTDGTPQGTSLLANLGPDDQQDRQLTNVNGTLYFRGHSLDEGFELWKSNGSATGTVMVRSLKPGSTSSNLTHFTNLQGTLFFSGNGELIKSNGTAAGTTRVKDLHIGASDQVSELEAIGNTLYFTAKSPTGLDGVSLYQTNGTNSGTRPIPSATGSTLAELTQLGSQLLYARNGNELWTYRPSASSPEAIISFAANRSVGELVNMNGSLFFVAGDSLWNPMGPPMVRSFLLEVMSEPHKTFLQVPTISIFPLAIEGVVALAAAKSYGEAMEPNRERSKSRTSTRVSTKGMATGRIPVHSPHRAASSTFKRSMADKMGFGRPMARGRYQNLRTIGTRPRGPEWTTLLFASR